MRVRATGEEGRVWVGGRRGGEGVQGKGKKDKVERKEEGKKGWRGRGTSDRA